MQCKELKPSLLFVCLFVYGRQVLDQQCSTLGPSLHLDRLHFSTSEDSFLAELGWGWVGVRNLIILLQ